MQPSFTRADLKAAIPDHCFRADAVRSSAYLLMDLGLIAVCYWALSLVSAWYLEAILLFLVGTLLWSVFVIGHEAGHGAFARSRRTNTIAGILAHSMILVPYRGWQRSHALHHAKTGHLREEEVFRACRADEDRLFRKVIFRSGIFVLIGWPLYKLGFRNIATYDPVKGSHYLTTSDLYAPHVKATWIASLVGVAVFLSIYIGLGMVFGWAFFAKYILVPYLVYGGWLSFVTYMQHVSPEVPVYDAGDWSGLKGALATVDRNYGPFGWLTHHTGDYHVIHHIFPTIPHYHAKEATEAIRPLLGDMYLRSPRFVLADFVRTLVGCHYVAPGEGREVYKSAYRFAPNFGGEPRVQAAQAAPDNQ